MNNAKKSKLDPQFTAIAIFIVTVIMVALWMTRKPKQPNVNIHQYDKTAEELDKKIRNLEMQK